MWDDDGGTMDTSNGYDYDDAENWLGHMSDAIHKDIDDGVIVVDVVTMFERVGDRRDDRDLRQASCSLS